MYRIDICDDNERVQCVHESDNGNLSFAIYRNLLQMVIHQGNKREGDAVTLTLYHTEEGSEDKAVLEEYKRDVHGLREPESS